MEGVIYKYTFSDGKVYIGQTRRFPEKRKQEHLKELTGKANTGFWKAYQELGEPKYEELFHFEHENEDVLVWVLNRVETAYIQQYRATDPRYGYNIKSFATSSMPNRKLMANVKQRLIDELTKDEISLLESAADKIRKRNGKLTKEELYIINEKYGKWDNDDEFAIHYDLENLEHNSEEAIFFMLEDLDYVKFLIEDAAEKKADEIIRKDYDSLLAQEHDKKVILQIDKEGNVVREFKSLSEICFAFKIPRADNVWNVLKGKQKTAYGFSWKYKSDYK